MNLMSIFKTKIEKKILSNFYLFKQNTQLYVCIILTSKSQVFQNLANPIGIFDIEITSTYNWVFCLNK